MIPIFWLLFILNIVDRLNLLASKEFWFNVCILIAYLVKLLIGNSYLIDFVRTSD